MLGVDVGTTNLKAAAFDDKGRILAIETTPTVLHQSAGELRHYDGAEIWSSVAALVRAVRADLPAERMVDAVSVTGMGEAVVPLDGEGDPLGPVIPWFDARSATHAQQLADTLSAEIIFGITGLDCHPIFSLAKIAWMRDHHPDIVRRVAVWLPVVDFVNFRLTGVAGTDFTEASRTLLLDLSNNRWSEQMIRAAGIDAATLPPIRASGTRLGSITRAAAAECGLGEGTPVVVGGHDHLCGSLAAGILIGKRILDSSGTAESFVGISQPGQSVPGEFRGLRLGRYLDPSRFVTWGGIIASGRSVDWAIDRLASMAEWGNEGSRVSYDTVNAAVADVPRGARSLLYIPHLRGCGAPHWNPQSRGAFVGLVDTHTQHDMLRAVFEGICFEARTIVELTETVFGSTVDTLNAVGGGTRSAVWQQIKADVTGKRVEMPEVDEATVLGAALLAGVGIGVFPDLETASRATYRARTVYTPNAEAHERYGAFFRVYEQLYRTLAPLNDALGALESSGG